MLLWGSQGRNHSGKTFILLLSIFANTPSHTGVLYLFTDTGKQLSEPALHYYWNYCKKYVKKLVYM